jgi:PQQ-like domain
VLAYPTSCATPCKPKWLYELGAGLEVGTPVVVDGKIFVSVDGRAGASCTRSRPRLYAFAENCGSGGALCKPLWAGFAKGSSSPAVANGVVYAGSVGGRLYAYAVNCAHGRRTCRPLFRSAPVPKGGSTFAASPAVAGGRVYYGAFTEVRAFGLRRSAR